MDTIMEEVDMTSRDTDLQTVRKELGGPANRRLNSTGTMIVGDTLSCPNNDPIMFAVAERLHEYIKESTFGPSVNVIRSPNKDERAKKARSSTKVSPVPPVRCENLPPKVDSVQPSPTAPQQQQNEQAEALGVPAVDVIAQYLRKIFRTAQCSVDCTIDCLIYVERLMQTSGLQLTPRNWRSLVAIGMLLASKVHDDLSMINADFACFLPFTVEQINHWERQFLAGIKYDVRVSAMQYTKYYFDLRERSVRKGWSNVQDGTLGAMDVERAQKLEVISSWRQNRVNEMGLNNAQRGTNSKLRRAVSDQYCPTHQNLQTEPGLPDAPAFAWHAHAGNFVAD